MSINQLVLDHRPKAVERKFLLLKDNHYCVFPLSLCCVRLCIEDNCINCVRQWIAKICQLAILQVAYSLKAASYQAETRSWLLLTLHAERN
jgi:hypothetical protein